MIVGTTQPHLADTDIRRAACLLVYRHGTNAPVQADLRYRALAAQRSSAADVWQAIRDYLAQEHREPDRWQALHRAAQPDTITRLSGSHNKPIAEPFPPEPAR